MTAAGVFVFSDGGLDASTVVCSVDPSSGSPIFTDGPFVETKEHLGGFAVVDVPDDAEARYWAGRIAVAVGWPQEVHRFPHRLAPGRRAIQGLVLTGGVETTRRRAGHRRGGADYPRHRHPHRSTGWGLLVLSGTLAKGSVRAPLRALRRRPRRAGPRRGAGRRAAGSAALDLTGAGRRCGRSWSTAWSAPGARSCWSRPPDARPRT